MPTAAECVGIAECSYEIDEHIRRRRGRAETMEALDLSIVQNPLALLVYLIEEGSIRVRQTERLTIGHVDADAVLAIDQLCIGEQAIEWLLSQFSRAKMKPY